MTLKSRTPIDGQELFVFMSPDGRAEIKRISKPEAFSIACNMYVRKWKTQVRVYRLSYSFTRDVSKHHNKEKHGTI